MEGAGGMQPGTVPKSQYPTHKHTGQFRVIVGLARAGSGGGADHAGKTRERTIKYIPFERARMGHRLVTAPCL